MRIEHVEKILVRDGRSALEMHRLALLMDLFTRPSSPLDPQHLFPHFEEFQERFLLAGEGDDGELLEEEFLKLYSHLHGHEVPYSRQERKRLDQSFGYWNHAGGLSPILKAGDHIKTHTVSGDFGAGNGLQCLLMQKLFPHQKTIQIEISSKAVEIGQDLQEWLGLGKEKVEWRCDDVRNTSPSGMDFIYLYRPLKPMGPGLSFYRRFADETISSVQEVTIFSVADCLKAYLCPEFEVFYCDGHLTCFKKLAR
jgi:hypothetical protein